MSARPPRLTLKADTAADLMSENPISLPEDAGVREAIAMMTDRGYSIAPVIDEAGRPVGVVSVTDILIHDRESVHFIKTAAAAEVGARNLPENMGIEVTDLTTVSEIMTPTVFTVRPTALTGEVIRTMLAYRVHHLFVADEVGTLIGVIGMSDILQKLG